jgi:transposase
MQSHLSQERRYAPPAFRGQQGPDRRRQIAHRGIQANAPGRTALQRRFSAIRPTSSIYERRREWDIENFFCAIKNFRRVATRYDKTDQSFTATIHLVAIALALK